MTNSKATDKAQKLFDGEGLFLFIPKQRSNASAQDAKNQQIRKWWRLKYRFGGKEKLLALGTYPQISLKEARNLKDKAKGLLKKGIDPSDERKINNQVDSGENSFEAIAREWFTKFKPKWSATYARKMISRLEKDVFPWIGHLDATAITAPDLLKVLRRMEARGVVEGSHRVRNNCGQIFRYAIATGRADRDVSADLKGALTPQVVKHHAAITDPSEIGALMRAIDGYSGSFIT